MQKINIGITVTLTILAVLLWLLSIVGSTSIYPRVFGLLTYMAVTLSLAACVGWVLVTVGSFRRDEYTRCRKCRHILRGLSAPRCPECGEPI